MSLNYRPEIDGLRSIAVLPVIFYHAGFSWFGGGYVGVDVFFVISGYLITSLILSDMANGQFTLLGFYERRARRILPALFFVIVCCLPFAWNWMLPAELRDFGQSVTAVVLFVSNFLFWSDAGYFGPAVETIPLIHTWSLAVEEQYYLLFPLLLMAVVSLGTRAVIAVLAVIALASLLFSGFASGPYPDLAFYLLPARAWELFLGGLIAIYLAGDHRIPFSKPVTESFALLGLGLIALAVFRLDNNTVFPGWAALLPVCGTGLLILFAQPGTLVCRILQLPLLVGVGLISYSAYLWHQPLFAFARIRSLQEPSELVYGGLILLTLCLAYTSWRLVETPFRNRQKFTRPQIFKTAAYSGALLLAVGVSLDSRGGFPDTLPPEYNDMLARTFETNPRQSECLSVPGTVVSYNQRCVYGDVTNITVALWGDSHANALAFELGDELAVNGMGLVEHSFSACLPVTDILRRGREDDCEAYNEETERELLQDLSIDTVVLMARWTLYLEGTVFDNGEGGLEPGSGLFALPPEQPDLPLESTRRKQRVAELYAAQVEKLLAAGKRVVVIYPVPEAGWHVPRFLAREILFDVGRDEYLSTDYGLYAERNYRAIAAFEALPDHPDLVRIYPDRLLCDSELPGRCLLQDVNGPLYSDDDHLNNRANNMLAREIVAGLLD